MVSSYSLVYLLHWEGLACETQCVYFRIYEVEKFLFQNYFDISSSSDQKEIDKVLSTVDNTTFGM